MGKDLGKDHDYEWCEMKKLKRRHKNMKSGKLFPINLDWSLKKKKNLTYVPVHIMWGGGRRLWKLYYTELWDEFHYISVLHKFYYASFAFASLFLHPMLICFLFLSNLTRQGKSLVLYPQWYSSLWLLNCLYFICITQKYKSWTLNTIT